jgi:hypothetical protein
MRFAPSPATRQERMDQFRRDRATAPILRVTFPTVEELRIELKFEAASSSVPTPQSHLLYPPARAFFEYPCPYWDCDGQFDLDGAVRSALADATRSAQGVAVCCGSRGRDPSSRRPCLLQVLYEITATFQRQN